MKVISLVPSITEALFDIGLTENEIIGRTKFCIHPADKVKLVTKIGGTKNLDINKIYELNPDIIIANREENVKDQIEELQKKFKVIVTDVSTLEDNYYLLKTLGNLFKKNAITQNYNLKIYDVFQNISSKVKIQCAYLIWKNPYMTIGSDTFIHHVMQELGFDNIFKNQKRYPKINTENLKEADVIMLSSEPFPFKENHIMELKEIYPNKKILIVDGEAFSWYGTRLAKCEDYFRELRKQVME